MAESRTNNVGTQSTVKSAKKQLKVNQNTI